MWRSQGMTHHIFWKNICFMPKISLNLTTTGEGSRRPGEPQPPRGGQPVPRHQGLHWRRVMMSCVCESVARCVKMLTRTRILKWSETMTLEWRQLLDTLNAMGSNSNSWLGMWYLGFLVWSLLISAASVFLFTGGFLLRRQVMILHLDKFVGHFCYLFRWKLLYLTSHDNYIRNSTTFNIVIASYFHYQAETWYQVAKIPWYQVSGLIPGYV